VKIRRTGPKIACLSISSIKSLRPDFRKRTRIKIPRTEKSSPTDHFSLKRQIILKLEIIYHLLSGTFSEIK